MKTIEKIAEEYIDNFQFDIAHPKRVCKKAFINGYKLAQDNMYSDMEEYATFCIVCDRKEMPLLLVKDWYEHYKSTL